MSGQRIEQIRERLQILIESAKDFIHPAPLYWYTEDVPVLLECISELEEENQRLRATLEQREEHLAEVRRGGEWFTDSGEVVEREMGPEGAAF